MNRYRIGKQIVLTAIFALWPALAANAAAEADRVWKINPAHSSVKFRVKSMFVMTTNGQFKTFSGKVIYDGKNLENAQVSAEIDPASLDTQLAQRDNHLKSKDFFGVSQYPTITFKSQRIETEETGAFKIIGLLTMHGANAVLTLHARPLESKNGNDSKKEKILTTTATTQLNRKDFGISSGPIDNLVNVTLQIELVHEG